MPESAIQIRQIDQDLPKLRAIFQSVGELDQLREFARGASLEVAQLKPGVMQGVLAHADLGLSSLHLNRLSLPARGRGAVSADRWTFIVFPVVVDGQFNSQALHPDLMLVYPPGSEFEGTTTGRYHDWVFTVGCDELSRVYGVVAQRELSISSRSVASLLPNPRKLKSLRDFAENTITLLEEFPNLLAADLIRATLHSQLMDLLSQTLVSACCDVKRRRRQRNSHWQVVREAEDFLRLNLADPIGLADLCASTEVSERTLRSAFLNVVGVSPNAYLKVIRLNRARAELEQSPAVLTTVTSIAMRCGFVHLGRFSQEYRNFFGELPSETMHRVHRITE